MDLVLSPADWHQRGWFLAVEIVTVQRIEGYRALLRVFDQDKTEFDLIIQFQGNEAWTFPLDKVRETDALLIRDPVLSQLPNGELGVTVVGTKTIKVCSSSTRLAAFQLLPESLKDLLPAERDCQRQDLSHAAETAAVREDVRATLDEAFTSLRCLTETEIDISYTEEADIAIRRLDLQDAANSTSQETKPNIFFEPFDIDQPKEMKINLCATNLAEEFLFERLWPDGEEVEPLPEMCGWLRMLLGFAKETGLVHSGYGDVLLDKYECFSNVADTYLVPWVIDLDDAYISPEDQGKPHVFISMINRCPPTDELLRVEALVVLGIMLSRLEETSLRSHRVMPVIALSCFKSYKARMLQVYMTIRGLVIKKSDLFGFSTAEARTRNIPLFVSHMASRPVGDTQSLAYRLPDFGYPRLQ
ncbi:hypothetical protein BJX62DRAFT_242407 [Aspergillus germanicus]